MKYLVIAAALLTLSLSTASAQSPSVKAENDAAMKAGREIFIAKTATFETDIKNKNFQAAQTTANNMLDLMRKGMSQIQKEINMEQGDVQKAGFKHFNDVEATVHHFTQLSRNVTATNSKELIKDAKTFITQY